MTLIDCLEEIDDFKDLIKFCKTYNIDECDDVYTEDEKNAYFTDNLLCLASRCKDWQELLESLQEIPDGYGYYNMHNGKFYELNRDDFYRYKAAVKEIVALHEM